jgi:RNA polymerase sigma factor (sigma-70 family)
MDDRDIFTILVRENTDMLTAYLRSVVRDPATVDDLFQETMLTAWRKLDEFDRRRPFGAWLRGIAARLVLAERRKRATGRSHFLWRVHAEHSERGAGTGQSPEGRYP